MSQFTNYERLPLIVHDLILRSLPSPKDVANTIRASPASLHVFVTGRRSILLSAMKNFFSLENQHLMNLVMAAPHFYRNRQSDCVPPAFSMFTTNDIKSVFYPRVFPNHPLRPLNLDTFDRFIKLYAVFGRMIKGYSLFTLARSHCRVPMLSTSEATRLRYHFTDCNLRTPDDKETSRLWRGFLLYELVCLMDGAPQMMAAASDETYDAYTEHRELDGLFFMLPENIREEIRCVHQYVLEQYELGFNDLVESFEVALAEAGRQDLQTIPPPTDVVLPIAELKWESSQSPLKYLVEPVLYHPNVIWTETMASLGVSVLHEFVCWDASTRLAFIRTTYPFLTNRDECHMDHFIRRDSGSDHGYEMRDIVACRFGWLQWSMIDPQNSDVHTCIRARLRAVGYIFWSSFDRLSFMNLEQNKVDEIYGKKGRLTSDNRLEGRPHLLEKLVKRQDWELIVHYYGPSFSKSQLNDIKDLFKSMDNLNSGTVTEMVSALRLQKEEHDPTEAKESGG